MTRQYTPADVIDVINFENRHCCMCQRFNNCDRITEAMTLSPQDIETPPLFVDENGNTGCMFYAEREKRFVRRVTIISNISATIETSTCTYQVDGKGNYHA